VDHRGGVTDSTGDSYGRAGSKPAGVGTGADRAYPYGSAGWTSLRVPVPASPPANSNSMRFIALAFLLVGLAALTAGCIFSPDKGDGGGGGGGTPSTEAGPPSNVLCSGNPMLPATWNTDSLRFLVLRGPSQDLNDPRTRHRRSARMRSPIWRPCSSTTIASASSTLGPIGSACLQRQHSGRRSRLIALTSDLRRRHCVRGPVDSPQRFPSYPRQPGRHAVEDCSWKGWVGNSGLTLALTLPPGNPAGLFPRRTAPAPTRIGDPKSRKAPRRGSDPFPGSG
jgi:hypothetical protein